MARQTNKRRTPAANAELLRAKMELVAARERGDAQALRGVLGNFPSHAAALIDFDAALVATSAYATVTPDATAQEVANRASARAFARVFAESPATQTVAQAAPAVAATSAQIVGLRALRQRRHLALKEVADRLRLGVDVLSSLEAGRIRAASVPERLTRALSELLDVAAETVQGALSGPVSMPMYQRARGGSPDEQPVLDFADAVARSPEMSAEQKAEWEQA